MRITIVTPSLSGGGAERSVVLLSEGFLQKGHTVAVVTLSSEATDSFQLPEGTCRLALDIVADSRHIIQALRNNTRRATILRRAIKATSPDVVMSHMTHTNVLTALALANTSYPLIAVEHSDPAINARGKIWQKMRRLIYPRVTRLISVSKTIDSYFDWLPPAKRAVIPNPVKRPEINTRGDHSADSHPKLIVAMGRLIHLKGFDRLLLAFAKVACRHTDWQLLILGEGELKSELQQMIDQLDLVGRVHLPGFVHNPFDLLRNADIFAMASRSEGFPYALLEAMSCSLPVVAMDCPSGPRQIIRPGIDGILVPDGDVLGFANAMERLMSDENERRHLAAHAAEVLERFGLERITAEWETLFASIIRDKPKSNGR